MLHMLALLGQAGLVILILGVFFVGLAHLVHRCTEYSRWKARALWLEAELERVLGRE